MNHTQILKQIDTISDKLIAGGPTGTLQAAYLLGQLRAFLNEAARQEAIATPEESPWDHGPMPPVAHCARCRKKDAEPGTVLCHECQIAIKNIID